LRNTYNKAAEVISAILSAPLIAIYTFAVLIYLKRPSSPILLLTISFLFGAILPLATIIYMAKKGIIPDINASDRQTRMKPFIAALISYLIGVITLMLVGAPQILITLMVCYFVNSLVMMAITRVWKISLHASGIAGPATFLVHELGLTMLPFFMLLIPTVWARIKLGEHDLNQVMAGALLTIGLTLMQLELFLML
jgi:uncharacterized membrane protein